MSIPGIPTAYNGVNYRSRLEATWAAFFDRVGWKHEYEPIDLDGWIPDFIIKGRHGPILVEVKPIVGPNIDLENRLTGVMQGVPEGGEFHGCDVLVLGCSPEWPFIGWIGEHFRADQGDRWSFGRATMLAWPDGEFKWGLCHETGRFNCRITGLYDGGGFLDEEYFPILCQQWAAAKNRVQYRAVSPSIHSGGRRSFPGGAK